MLDAIRQLFTSPRDGLFQANPWLETPREEFASVFALPNGVPNQAVAAARRMASLARLRAGSAAWNSWATVMQALGTQLAGDAKSHRMWAYLATTDFTGQAFGASPDGFVGMMFPATLDLTDARFVDTAWFSSATFHGDAVFRDAHFPQGANFERAVFSAGATFDGASFGRSGEFRSAEFGAPASFRGTRFVKDAWFRGSRFAAALDMTGVSFGGEAGLGAIRYGGPADFSQAVFGDNAGFEAATFEDVARFDDARFERNARFEQAVFKREPSFGRARFLGRVIFDGVTVPEGSSPVHQTIADLMRRLG